MNSKHASVATRLLLAERLVRSRPGNYTRRHVARKYEMLLTREEIRIADVSSVIRQFVKLPTRGVYYCLQLDILDDHVCINEMPNT